METAYQWLDEALDGADGSPCWAGLPNISLSNYSSCQSCCLSWVSCPLFQTLWYCSVTNTVPVAHTDWQLGIPLRNDAPNILIVLSSAAIIYISTNSQRRTCILVKPPVYSNFSDVWEANEANIEVRHRYLQRPVVSTHHFTVRLDHRRVSLKNSVICTIAVSCHSHRTPVGSAFSSDPPNIGDLTVGSDLFTGVAFNFSELTIMLPRSLIPTCSILSSWIIHKELSFLLFKIAVLFR